MTYTIDIQGMHCSGCTNLISMALEDADFTNIRTDFEKHTSTFVSDKGEEEIKETLDKIFSDPDLKEYAYTNLSMQ